MKYRPKIGGGDFDTKTRKVEQFLGEGHKVKVTIMFRGREVAHPELGSKILDHVADEVAHRVASRSTRSSTAATWSWCSHPTSKAQAAHAAKLQSEAEASNPRRDATDAEAPDSTPTTPDSRDRSQPKTQQPSPTESRSKRPTPLASPTSRGRRPADVPTTDQD